MKKPIFALVPSAYKTSTVYSPIPYNGDGDFYHTRSSYATRMNKEGLLESLGWYQPRLDYSDSKCPALLVEHSATNLMPYSEDFTQGWNNFNILDTANAGISPDGKLNATKLERTITTASYTTDSFTKPATATQYTSSVFVKQGDTPYFAVRSQGNYPARVDLRFNFATKSFYYAVANTFTDLTHKVEELPNGWFRLQWTYTTDTATLLTGVSMSPKTLDSNTDGSDLNYGYAYVWGAQCEEFNNATSYIKTIGSSASRGADFTETTTNLANANIINSKKGTMYAEISSTDNVGTYQGVRLCLNSSRDNNNIRFIFSPTNRVRVIYRVAGTSILDWSTDADDITTYQKFSISWSEDKLLVVVNGVVVATQPLPYLLSGLDLLDVYRGVRIKEWKIWDEELTEAELIKLTS